MTTLSEQDPYFQFLTATLGEGPIEVYSLAGDASARKYFRVVLSDNSFVLMSWEPFESEETYPFLNVLNHFQKQGVHVPKVINASKREGFVLLEDLGDLTLERKFWESQNPSHVTEFYHQAIDEIVKIHYLCSADRASGCIAFDIEFNTQRLLWEMNYAREHFLEKFLNLKFSSKESDLLEEQFTHICERLHKEPKFIAHRDYHSRNLMIKGGKMRVIDFQDARLGPIQYDLVSLFRDSYVDIPPEMEKNLIQYYLECRKKYFHEGVDLPDFNTIYELQSIQRCLKACGSFASFFNMRQDTRYLKHIAGTLIHVKNALALFPEYKPLFQLLSDRGLFEKEIIIP